METTAVVRQRGQLTIPDNLRRIADWLSSGSVVQLQATSREIKISPYQNAQKIIDWDVVWEKIRLSRTFRGKVENLSEFIAADRARH